MYASLTNSFQFAGQKNCDFTSELVPTQKNQHNRMAWHGTQSIHANIRAFHGIEYKS